MARGILRLCSYHKSDPIQKLQVQSQRWFSSEYNFFSMSSFDCDKKNSVFPNVTLGSSSLFEKSAKPSESIKGIPYKQLKIGVGKEKWTDEKRCVTERNYFSHD